MTFVARMHPDEAHTDVGLVRHLLAAQFPEWAGLQVEPVEPGGTDNAIYRLGRELAVRLPRREKNILPLRKERRWLPRLAPVLPLAIPIPPAHGEPGEGYPFEWAVYRWLPGRAVSEEPLRDDRRAASDLAEFVAALQRVDSSDGPPPGEHNVGRGEPVAARDEATRTAISSIAGLIDARAATEVWEAALRAPAWTASPVWIHGDLDARNLLVEDGRLTAVVDFGCLGVGDPACDVMVAWKLLGGDARRIFRAALEVDEPTWVRARGWAVSQAVMALAYYTTETNAVLLREAERWIAEVLADDAS